MLFFLTLAISSAHYIINNKVIQYVKTNLASKQYYRMASCLQGERAGWGG